MRLSQRGAELIANFEGVVLGAYNDPVGHCTCGIGHLLHRGGCTRAEFAKWKGMTRKQAYDLLAKDARPRIRAIERLVKVPLNQSEIDALTSLVFNIGEGGFASSSVLRHLNAGRRKRAATAFLMWVKADGQTLLGLVRRRQAEAALFRTDVVKPVRLSSSERYHLALARNMNVSARRRARARDWLRHQATVIQRTARKKGRGSWKAHDRGRRFQVIRRFLKK